MAPSATSAPSALRAQLPQALALVSPVEATEAVWGLQGGLEVEALLLWLGPWCDGGVPSPGHTHLLLFPQPHLCSLRILLPGSKLEGSLLPGSRSGS